MARIRLHLDHPLAAGQPIALTPDQAHYLVAVMRQGVGDEIFVFNGRQGEWRARLLEAGKKRATLEPITQSAPQRDPPDLWLLFAPIKKARTDFIVEKAAELGAARIIPVQTAFTNAERIRQDRLQAHAMEAAEQCGGTFVPEVAPLTPLPRLLEEWAPARRLMWCDESRAGAATALNGQSRGPWAILIGPEGGFSDAERARLAGMAASFPVSLGPRILRADTAAVAAITLWQAALGDWG